MAPTSRSTIAAAAALAICLGVIDAAAPAASAAQPATGIATVEQASRDTAGIPVHATVTGRGLRVKIRWDDRLSDRPGRNGFHVRAVAVTGDRATVLTALHRSRRQTGTRVYTLRLGSADRAAMRDADRTVVAVTQQHDDPDGDRRYERGHATVTTVDTPSGEDPSGGRDCRGVPIGQYADLHDCDLTGASLDFWILKQVNLSGATLVRATRVGAVLIRTDLTRADLTAATMFRTRLESATMPGATLTRADLTDAYLTSVNLAGANLAGANLAYAHLVSANLAGANLAGANLFGAKVWSYTDLSGADLTDANLDSADLNFANLTGANLDGAKLTNVELYGSDFSFATWVDGGTCDRGSIGQCLRGGRPV